MPVSLADETVAAVTDAARRCYRHGAPVSSSITVRLNSDRVKVGYAVRVEYGWHTFPSGYRGHTATEDHHAITVPRDWIRTVAGEGLAVLDGMLTLTASPLACPVEGVRLYSASWAAQSHGYQVRTEHGYIAVLGRAAYHAATPQRALEGLARKTASRLKHITPRTAAIMGRAEARYGHVAVTLNDAYAIGACEYGVAHWLQRVDLYCRDTATVAEVVAAWRDHPAPEAVRAVYHAIRRHRRSLRATGGRAAA